ncbi:3-like protein [Plasmopara halstedii]|uniref:Sugar transporter SWEET1 n=1 Tax=Plasmopara halstedii TaxID=4781 RepID=A0A0P1AIJ6_PLAHL|nr:3-like protein [Plasmopara halstedii]CEG40633.1 3-like protein [Plasmopara halstedii]|eukprot:XP_024577002.1 3-like protein [Plasmopara halstedii]
MTLILSILRALTTIAALFVGLSPLPDYYRIYQTHTTGEVSILPITLLFCNSFMWTIYGFWTHNIFPVFVCNLYGMTTSIVFSSIFYRWSTDRASVLKIWSCAACILAIGTFYLILGSNGVTNQNRDQVASTFGFVAVAINIALYASPLASMKKVIETKDASSLPITISIVFLGNAALWVLYAIIAGDMFVMVPNLLGMLLCTAQVALYLRYRLKTNETAHATIYKSKVADGSQRYWDHIARWFRNPLGYELLSAPVAPLPR